METESLLQCKLDPATASEMKIVNGRTETSAKKKHKKSGKVYLSLEKIFS
jgi:hypothetical protein